MVTSKCKAKNPATCRYHGQSMRGNNFSSHGFSGTDRGGNANASVGEREVGFAQVSVKNEGEFREALKDPNVDIINVVVLHGQKMNISAPGSGKKIDVSGEGTAVINDAYISRVHHGGNVVLGDGAVVEMVDDGGVVERVAKDGRITRVGTGGRVHNLESAIPVALVEGEIDVVSPVSSVSEVTYTGVVKTNNGHVNRVSQGGLVLVQTSTGYTRFLGNNGVMYHNYGTVEAVLQNGKVVDNKGVIKEINQDKKLDSSQ